MKNLKKLAGLLLALTLVFALSVPAMAADDGSITVNGISAGVTYKVYKLLDLTLGVDGSSKTYSYKLPVDAGTEGTWSYFFKSAAIKDVYVTIDAGNHVKWIDEKNNDKAVAEFAKLALAYAQKYSIAATGTHLGVAGTTSHKFENLPLGYYLVDSTVGALCGLTTTDKDASITAKNGAPTIEKKVMEDSTSQWGDENTADIGQLVEYRVTINVHAGAQNYVLHDEMAAGLTFQNVTKIEHVVPGTDTHVVNSGKYTVRTQTTTPAAAHSGCDFEVHFTKELCDELQTNDKLVVYYNAMLNRHAVIDDGTGGNVNQAKLSYGDGHETTYDQVTTYTYSIDIVKTDDTNKLIEGAEFRIYDALTGGNEIAVVPLLNADDSAPVTDANGNPMYRRARTEETGVAIKVWDETSKTVGQITVVGLDNGTYYLEETKAPDGYNPIIARQKFIISDACLSATYNGAIYSTGSGVHVVNKTGAMLPETGGMGTVLFVTFGMLMVLGTGVLLVTKKRMAMIED